VPDPIEPGARGDTSALMMAFGATLGLSIKGIFGKLAFIAGASVIVLVLVRMLLAVPLFLLADRAIRPEGRAAMTQRDMGMGLGFGLMFLVAMLTDFNAIDILGAGLSRIVLFTYPLIVVLIASAMERRWPSMRQLLAFAISYIGLIIVLRPDRAELPAEFWTGVASAVLCAVTIASMYAFANPLMKRIGAARFSILTHVSAAIGMIVIATVTQTPESFDLTWEVYFWIAMIVIFATVVPMMMQYEAMRRIGASRVSLIGLLGPVVTVFLAWLVLGERLDAIQLIGFCIVLSGVILLEWPSLKRAINR